MPASKPVSAAGADTPTMNESSFPWMHTLMRVGVTAAAHPVEYVKVLIQLGYEPLPPRPTKTIFGKQALSLPGIFEYMGHIHKRDGFFGLYRGVVPRVSGSLLSGYVFNKVTESLPVETFDEEDEYEMRTTEDKISEFLQVTCRDMVARCMAIIISHPFQVITVRTIGQFVGGESIYNGFFSAVSEVYSGEGFIGFFSGVGPRIMAEVLSLWISSSLTFVINTYLVEDVDFKPYTSASMAFIASAITYPLNLVSNIMAVNNSGLAVGGPPHMPIYHSWKDCWRHLNKQNQLKRGSSLLWRYYTGPYQLSPEDSLLAEPGSKRSTGSKPSSTVRVGTSYNLGTAPAFEGIGSGGAGGGGPRGSSQFGRGGPKDFRSS